MQLGRTLVGAIIGAVIGIAIMVAVYLAISYDGVWLALAVAILTGLGVRMMVATGGHASYLRGAITGALALGAYLLGWSAVASFAQQNAAAASKATRIEQPANPGNDAEADDTEAGAEAVETEAPKAAPAPRRAASGRTPQSATMPRGFSTMDFIILCAAGLIAYELGRGTAGKPAVVGEETVTEVPTSNHPDA